MSCLNLLPLRMLILFIFFYLLKNENVREVQSSYDLLLQQQQLFLQWQREVEESRALDVFQVN